ncbi:MBL fold metallo-hydrolase [Agreia sp. COWG]|uniref:MBL fold metallo-hydrolase n=1 Tax=Agreia sp. COWG TaxID=2773266 RepID=UPI0019279034|nr:MBL fold metallo-hydrolase [Agreia sp. COWG]CAD6001696.1 Glyoxylase, beta-lactamase superfamily II [Agreia sp. COWG]
MPHHRAAESSVHEIADGVYFVEGPASNWTILADDQEVTLIDAGYPGDASEVQRSLRSVAPDLPLRNILVTHGHSDHIGSIPHLVAHHDATVWAAREEIPNIRREVLHQIGVADLLPKLFLPRYLVWMVHAIRAGGLAPIDIEAVSALMPDAEVTFSGMTIVPRLTAGHTPGHLTFELPDQRVLITGDTLITAHATTTTVGLQELGAMWHWDATAAHSSALSIARNTHTLLPGHGPLHHPRREAG